MRAASPQRLGSRLQIGLGQHRLDSAPGTIGVLIADGQRFVREGLGMLVALLGDVLIALTWS
jgi:hypothetical protein